MPEGSSSSRSAESAWRGGSGVRQAGRYPPSRTRLLPWLRWWAELLDSRFQIPGTRIRFGIDPILSLIPGAGELASPIYTAVLLAQAFYQGIPRVVVARMLINALIDAAIGAIPLVGQVGDVFWRANLRNLALLERHADPSRPPERVDYAFLVGAIAVFGAVAAILALAALWLAVWFWRRL